MFPLGNITFIFANEMSFTSYFGTSASSPSTFLKPSVSSPTNSGAKYFLNVSTCLFLNASVTIFSKRTIDASLCAVFLCVAGVATAKQVETAVASATPQIMTCRFIIESRPSAEFSSKFSIPGYFNSRAQVDGRGGGSGGRFDEDADAAGTSGNGAKSGKNSSGTKPAHTS